MTIDEFCVRHPLLYHMATAGSLQQIERYGLLSTAAILELTEQGDEVRKRLLSERRPKSVVLTHPVHGSFTLRDQKPMSDSKLAGCLVDMDLPAWYELLNSRVFMWASKERVETLLGARAYRRTEHLILTIDPRPLLESHHKNVSVSAINSGATFYVPVKRGKATFVPLADYPVGRGVKPIVEITVSGGVPDISKFIVRSETRKCE